MVKYYDGHYEKSNMSLEEIEQRLIEEKEKSEKLTEWFEEN